MRILAEDTAVLVVDYQERLMPAMHHWEGLEHNSDILLKGLKNLGVPMVISQQYTKGLGMTIPSIFKAAETEVYFDKMAFSCYDDKEIKDKIDGLGKKNIIVCGIETHVCVLQSCIDLKAAGYNVLLAADCTASRKPGDKKMGLRRAVQEGVMITTYEAILFELLRKAGGDVFKAISKLIK